MIGIWWPLEICGGAHAQYEQGEAQARSGQVAEPRTGPPYRVCDRLQILSEMDRPEAGLAKSRNDRYSGRTVAIVNRRDARGTGRLGRVDKLKGHCHASTGASRPKSYSFCYAHRAMPLAAGTRLGRYVIEAPLGAGGMGDVYLAEDTGLHRRVALKLLPAATADDDTARRRLVREAQAAAGLDHPNICTIFEVGEADGHSYIAMQYVDGETLAVRLRRGPLDLSSAIALGRQVAEALAEAHRLGIVHRDIKPQNIMLTRLNQAKVLDFGIAKTSEPVGGELHTASALTEPGLMPGTTAYMSPEQARCEHVDQRSDIFSFGIVLFETLSRANPFAHASSAETASAILTKDPTVSDIAAPAELRRILRKCLEKDRERRYQTMRDVVIDLENLARDLTETAAVGSIHTKSRHVPWALPIAVLAVLAGATIWWLNRGSPPLSTSDYEQLTNFADSATAPTLSPDGRTVAFIRGGTSFLTRSGQIFVKQLPNGEAVQLTNDPQPKLAPAFSPDGARVAYTLRESETGAPEGWNTWTVPVSGGQPTRMLPNAAAVTWIDNRHILFPRSSRTARSTWRSRLRPRIAPTRGESTCLSTNEGWRTTRTSRPIERLCWSSRWRRLAPGAHVVSSRSMAARPDVKSALRANAVQLPGRRTADGCTSARSSTANLTSGDSAFPAGRLKPSRPALRPKKRASPSRPTGPRSSHRLDVVRARCGCTSRAASGCSRRRVSHSIRVCRRMPPESITCCGEPLRLAPLN